MLVMLLLKLFIMAGGATVVTAAVKKFVEKVINDNLIKRIPGDAVPMVNAVLGGVGLALAMFAAPDMVHQIVPVDSVPDAAIVGTAAAVLGNGLHQVWSKLRGWIGKLAALAAPPPPAPTA